VQSASPATPPESLAGLIERVTFFNEDTGFAVLKVKARGHRDLVCVVGALASVAAGEYIHGEGRWVQDREYGLQFRADVLTSTAPTTREGIEKYLGSGMVKGIGPVYARKLVAKFGEQIFDIIDRFSARLEEVEGIGPKRRHRIKEAWSEQKAVREIMVFLHSHGVSTSRAVRIYRTYGAQAVETVRRDPYCLARDIHGIGFKTADEIARKLGVPHDSIERACAGLDHVLLTATNDGHCALPNEALKEEAEKLLSVGPAVVDAALDRALAQGNLAQETIEDQALLFLPRLQRAEEAIANSLCRLAAMPPAFPSIDLDKAVAWCQAKTGTELAPTQREALRKAWSARVLVVTGGPGVGKTTLVKSILLILRAKRVRCLLCAPTGRAAKRMAEATGFEAKTIHRLLEAQPGSGGFLRNEANPLDCDYLVVDEMSMVDVPLMHQLLRALPRQAGLLLVGDADQLPSVGPGLVLRHVIESGAIPVARLTEIFRQAAHSQIVITAHRVNEGQLPPPLPPNTASDFYFVERSDPEAILHTVIEMVKRRIPTRFHLNPVGDVQVLCPMNRGLLGMRQLNVRLQAELNPQRPDQAVIERFGWQFRIGDKVMQTENNYDKEVFNGDLGRVERIDMIEREMTVRFDQRDVIYDFGELDEVVLAYAITVHKSQGSEFPAVVMPLAMQHYLLLQRNLLYTGITRGKRLVVLVGQANALALAVRNNRTRHRFSGLLARLRREGERYKG
jgi:exodeoxyribonuclease V alpha subunit